MSLTRYDGAWIDTTQVRRYDTNGSAWVDCESLKRHDGSTWTEVWANDRPMTMLDRTFDITKTHGLVIDVTYHKVYEVHSNVNVDLSDNNKSVTFYLDGHWYNPTVTFTCGGQYKYYQSLGGQALYKTAGGVSIYQRTAIGNVSYSNYTACGNASGETETDVSVQLSGEFDRIGFKMDFSHDTVSAVKESFVLDTWLFKINGTTYVPSTQYDW